MATMGRIRMKKTTNDMDEVGARNSKRDRAALNAAARSVLAALSKEDREQIAKEVNTVLKEKGVSIKVKESGK
jgi:hypothetical protein